MAPQTAKVTEKKEAVATPVDKGHMFELICQRAYDLYEQRGGAHGNDIDDWLQAEAEVRASIAAHEAGK
jgi:hypothetical protein